MSRVPEVGANIFLRKIWSLSSYFCLYTRNFAISQQRRSGITSKLIMICYRNWFRKHIKTDSVNFHRYFCNEIQAVL